MWRSASPDLKKRIFTVQKIEGMRNHRNWPTKRIGIIARESAVKYNSLYILQTTTFYCKLPHCHQPYSKKRMPEKKRVAVLFASERATLLKIAHRELSVLNALGDITLACAKKNHKNDSHPQIKQTEMPPTPGEVRCLMTQDFISFCRQVQVLQVDQVPFMWGRKI